MKKTKWINNLMACFAMIAISAAIVFPLVGCKSKVRTLNIDFEIACEQVGEEQFVNVSWDTDANVDAVLVNVVRNGEIEYTQTVTSASALVAHKTVVPAFYGKHTIEVSLIKGIRTTEVVSKEVALSASEYNIAPLVATLPVTVFALSLDEITDGGRIPTFVWLQRAKAWNYSELPENVYVVPTATEEQITASKTNGVLEGVDMYGITAQWIKELYEINKNSIFHLYYNDFWPAGWLDATIAKGIPAANYNVVLLSDGTGTYSQFKKNFNNDNFEAKYEEMLAQYETLKQEYVDGVKNKSITGSQLGQYAYVMTKAEENVEWWINRYSGTMATSGTDLYNEFESLKTAGKIKLFNLGNLLSAMTDAEKAQIKKLYHFGDEMFDYAKQNDKKIMIILGTSPAGEVGFDEYFNALKLYYGDEYAYYYKGHPGYPSDEAKQAKFEEMGLLELDGSIAAELIFFFNPEAFGSGYQSTTFQSLENEQCEPVTLRGDN